MANGVAEFNLILTLAAFSDLLKVDRLMKENREKDMIDTSYLWSRTESIFRQRFGFIGFGTIGRSFLEILLPFEPEVLIL